jgi:hypothetical protein
MIVELKFVTPCKKGPFPSPIFIVGEPGMVEPNKNVYRKPPTKTNYFQGFLKHGINYLNQILPWAIDF